MPPGHDVRRKRLRYRAGHRGSREMDLLLGAFAARHLGAMTSGEMADFERLLELPDPDLHAEIMAPGDAKPAAASPVMQQLRSMYARR